MPVIDVFAGDPACSNRVFDPELVEKAFSQPPSDPSAFHTYLAGLKYNHRDYQVIIFGVREDGVAELVLYHAEECGDRPWTEVNRQIDKLLEAYPGRLRHHAQGFGELLGDYLHRRSRPYYINGGRQKVEMYGKYITDLETGKIQFPPPVVGQMEDLKRFHLELTWMDLYGMTNERTRKLDGLIMAWRPDEWELKKPVIIE